MTLSSSVFFFFLLSSLSQRKTISLDWRQTSIISWWRLTWKKMTEAIGWSTCWCVFCWKTRTLSHLGIIQRENLFSLLDVQSGQLTQFLYNRFIQLIKSKKQSGCDKGGTFCFNLKGLTFRVLSVASVFEKYYPFVTMFPVRSLKETVLQADKQFHDQMSSITSVIH